MVTWAPVSQSRSLRFKKVEGLENVVHHGSSLSKYCVSDEFGLFGFR